MNNEKYLPLGSVVLLKSGNKRLMITGYCMTVESKPNKEFDYCGCLFPEGVQITDENFLFDHNQIKEIVWFGLLDDEGQGYIDKIKGIRDKID